MTDSGIGGNTLFLSGDLHRTLVEFSSLTRGLIDTSSVLYMSRAGFWHETCEALELLIIPGVLAELKYQPPGPWRLLSPRQGSVDDQLVGLAQILHLPVISEDRRLLLKVKRARLPHFNSLMILTWLLWKRRISSVDHDRWRQELLQFARYGAAVQEYGEKIRSAVLESLDNDSECFR